MRTDSEQTEARWMPRILAGVAGFCGQRPWPLSALPLLTCGLSLYANFAHLEYQTHRNDLLSPNLEVYKRWQQYVHEFGDDDDMVVVVRARTAPRWRRARDAGRRSAKGTPTSSIACFTRSDLRSPPKPRFAVSPGRANPRDP